MTRLAPGDRIAGRYTVEQPLGQGAMGTVWLCRDEVLGRPVAIKQIGGFTAEDEQAALRAQREARAAAAIGHTHAVSVYDIVDADDHAPWLIMEYVEGGTLADLVAQHGRLPASEVARIGAEVASALSAAHAAGIVHRDIKPGNILVDRFGRAKISDFGIARAQGDEALTQVGFVTGTPAYFAPELARGEAPSAASDVWALGATLYYAVEGRLPYDSDPNPLTVLRRIDTSAPRPTEYAGEFDRCLPHMMDRAPRARWTMQEASERLARFASGGASLAFGHDEQTRSLAATAASTQAVPGGGWHADPGGRSGGRSGGGTAHGGTGADDGPARPRRLPWVLGALAVLLLAAALGYLAVTSLAGDESTAEPQPPPTSSSAPPPSTASTTPPSTPAPTSSTSSTPSPTVSTTTVTQTPSSTPSSSSAPSTPTPTPSSSSSPSVSDDDIETFLSGYYETVADDPGATWGLLTPSAQSASQGYDSYMGFWGDNIEDVSISDISTDASSLTATATVSYATSDDETSEETVEYSFVQQGGSLLMDGFRTI